MFYLFCHMPRNQLDTVGGSAVIEYMAYFDSFLPFLWILICLFHFLAKRFIFLPPVWRYTDQSLVIGISWESQGIAKWHRVIDSVILHKSHNVSYCSFVNMVVAFFNISFSILRSWISFWSAIYCLSVTVSSSDTLMGRTDLSNWL